VTAPVSARLTAVAAWEPPRARGAVAALALAEGVLPSWRLRLESLGRDVADARRWAGPAAAEAASALLELTTVAAVAARAVEESLAALHRMLTEVAAAQDAAATAITAAGGDPHVAAAGLVEQQGVARAAAALVPGAAPLPPPAVVAGAAAALEHADAAGVAVRAAEEALCGLPADDGFDGLAAALLAAGPPPVPHVPSAGPEAVSDWFTGLLPAEQLAVIAAAPATMGRLDGVPAWARDRANRLLLSGALADPALGRDQAATARAVADRIAAEEAAGRQVQLHLLDLDGDRVALAVGDLDTAGVVAVLVPGIATTPADDLPRLTGDARDLADAASAAGAVAVATLVWLGYRTPTGPGIGSRGAAWRGGAELASALAGLAAVRGIEGAPAARTTVLAHSYGTVVVDEAADLPGELAADAVVLLGSHGMEETAATLEVAEVYDAAATDDLVARLGWFGLPPDVEAYGAVGLPADPRGGHSGYYDPGRPTLPALGRVVAGVV
jgi:hypothetical protein